MAKIVMYPQRGIVQITDKGRKILKSGSFTLQDINKDSDFLHHQNSTKRQKESDNNTIGENSINSSPQDLIDSGFSSIKSSVKSDLLDKLKDIDPYYFEKVIKMK